MSCPAGAAQLTCAENGSSPVPARTQPDAPYLFPLVSWPDYLAGRRKLPKPMGVMNNWERYLLELPLRMALGGHSPEAAHQIALHGVYEPTPLHTPSKNPAADLRGFSMTYRPYRSSKSG